MNEKEFLNNREYICAYCLNKNEDKLCDDYSNDCDKVNMLRNDYSDYLEDCITELFDKKQQFISFLEDKIKEYKLCFPEVVKALQEVLDFVKGGKDEKKVY